MRSPLRPILSRPVLAALFATLPIGAVSGQNNCPTFLTRTPGPAGAHTAWVHAGNLSHPVGFGTTSAPLGPGCGLVNGGFHNGLFAWDVLVTGTGTPSGGVSIVGGRARLDERASFLVSLYQTFCLPVGSRALSFELVATAFDRTDNFVPDAFEVSLLDASLAPVAPSWSPFATSFFNVQEDGTVRQGPLVTYAGGVVTLDVSNVPTGVPLTLFVDLIGADADHGSYVLVDGFALDTGAPGTEFCLGIGCPCGNDTGLGGCANSLGVGAQLSASGTGSVSADDLVLTIEHLPSSYALVVGGQLSNCTPLGDGLLSVSLGPFQPGLLRFLVTQQGPGGALTLGPGILDYANTVLGAGGLLIPGTTWHFQAVYRDGPISPCGSNFNLSNGVGVSFSL